MKLRKFTLIELLIVVAIIGILAAILLPALLRAKQMANRIVCLSNFKQCHMALTNYADDNDGTMIKLGSSTSHNLDFYAQGDDDLRNMGSYLGNDYSIWACPVVPQQYKLDDPINSRSELRCNYFYIPDNTQIDFFVERSLTKQDSEDLIICDLNYQYNGMDRTNHSSGGEIRFRYPTDNPSLVMYYDGKSFGVNAVFGDGHGLWFDSNELVDVGGAGLNVNLLPQID